MAAIFLFYFANLKGRKPFCKSIGRIIQAIGERILLAFRTIGSFGY
jgi:hypothetical protein